MAKSRPSAFSKSAPVCDRSDEPDRIWRRQVMPSDRSEKPDSKAARAYVAGGVYDPPDEAWETKGQDAQMPEGMRRPRKGPPRRKSPSETEGSS